MASNSFGNHLKMTTWGESHGEAIGVVVDGCPAGIPITQEEINLELSRRAPGNSSYTSPRKENDHVVISSGVFEGVSTGAPISLIIKNKDADSSKYEPIKDFLRPGHANYTYQEKYGVFDYRGGGRASARETAGRVAAGAIAKKILKYFNIHVIAYLKQVSSAQCNIKIEKLEEFYKKVLESPIFCPDTKCADEIMSLLNDAKLSGDSLGGIVEFFVDSAPVGLGDPVYEKLEANLAKAMMGLPGSKGFEIGSGFSSVLMKGSEHNDPYEYENQRVRTTTNHSGGILGGISNGMPIVGRVAFKPTSSIAKPQQTLNKENEKATFTLPAGSRHDPCIAIRAVPVVEAMTALVIADALLMNRISKL